MRGLIKAGLAIAAGATIFCGGFLAARSHYRVYQPGEHAVRRTEGILSQARLRRFDTIMFGDSITEFAYLPDICSGPVLNAGIAGGRLADVERLLPLVLALQRPKSIVFAIGLNDANLANPTDPQAFGARYARLVRLARQGGATVRIASITPVTKDLIDADGPFDAEHIAAFNREIERMGRPLAVRAKLAGADGLLPARDTTDGAHLTPLGYVPWRDAIREGCAS